MGRPVAPRGEGRARLVEAALGLFAVHGVHGTSLQMIADALGVTKAAVYHQFHSKSEIVLAVAAPALEQMARVAEAAEALPAGRARAEAALAGLVDLVLEHRVFSAAMQRDPEVRRLLDGESLLRPLAARIDAALLGPEPSDRARIALALIGGGLLASAVDPALADQPADRVRREFVTTCRRALAPHLAE